MTQEAHLGTLCALLVFGDESLFALALFCSLCSLSLGHCHWRCYFCTMLVFAIGFSFEPGFSSISFFDLLDAFLENTFVEGFLLELSDRVNVLIEELAKSCSIFGE